MELRPLREKRAAALLGLCVLAVAALVVSLIVIGGGSSDADATVTTPAGSPIHIHKPHIAKVGGVYVGDVKTNLVGNPTVTLLKFPEPHHYQLTVTNASAIGSVNEFEWYPPNGIQPIKVTGSSSGNCKTSGTYGIGGSQFATAVLDPTVLCHDLNLKPPTCTCTYDGGYATVTVIADVAERYIGGAGVARVISMTPVFDAIPTHVGTTPTVTPCGPPHCVPHG